MSTDIEKAGRLTTEEVKEDTNNKVMTSCWRVRLIRQNKDWFAKIGFGAISSFLPDLSNAVRRQHVRYSRAARSAIPPAARYESVS